MGTTPNYHWPYPELNSSPDGATQIKALGLATDTTVKSVDTRVGSNETRLTAIETQVNVPLVQVRQTVAQSIANGGSSLLFDVEEIDTHGMHSTSSQTSRLTATVAGWYFAWGNVSFAAGTTGRRGAIWQVSGVASVAALAAPMSTNYTQINAPTFLCRLNVGEYLELQAYQDTGAALLTYVAAAGNRPWIGARWVLPY